MKRFLFYILKSLAFLSRVFGTSLYMKFIISAHKVAGVRFIGQPEYIQSDAYLDPSGGLTINANSVISTKVIVLTHDWSFLKRNKIKTTNLNQYAFKPVIIGENSFIGAGAIILPGSIIGKNCIIGAGAVVKGNIPENSVVVGNPSKIIGSTEFSN